MPGNPIAMNCMENNQSRIKRLPWKNRAESTSPPRRNVEISPAFQRFSPQEDCFSAIIIDIHKTEKARQPAGLFPAPNFLPRLELLVEIAHGARDVDSARDAALAV